MGASSDKPDTSDKATEDPVNSVPSSDGVSNSSVKDSEPQKENVETKTDRSLDENNIKYQCREEESKLDKMEEFTDTAAYWIVCTNWP
ncbi:Hypp1950 [Branchiostoma lanceolatum]|uniref:Hypp1949 protein n=1 Tax=Branchiostoma lanceolatum TaxID=7740 RepID=A0A8K0EQN2_BRALA|nr:Hypp1949 [Branchiostoma lanceolatum]CAH1258033.1 Hypp1950 [Branchiostoma lanceolatum]